MSGFSRLVHGETNIDFGKWWRRGVALSAVLLTVSLGSLVLRGLNLGIDFEGGTSWEVVAPGHSVSDVREELAAVGQSQAKIQIVGTDVVRVQSDPETPEKVVEVTVVLADMAGVAPSDVSVSTVGPSWGSEITSQAVRALVVFLVVLLIYLTVRLEWQMALGAVVSLIHDIVISVGVYSIFQFEVTPATVIAFLTILGYSIYDTIVVFDKVKENEPRVTGAGRLTYTAMMSRSMNQVLLRSINTTVCAILPIVALLVVGAGIMGAATLEEFAIALFVGMVVGAYSSILIAPPVVIFFKEREPRYRKVRERIEAAPSASSGTRSTSSGEGASASVSTTSSASTSSAPSKPTAPGAVPPRTYSGAIPPRPRKKGKKR